MKQHSLQFKTGIKELGRKITGKITYSNIELSEELYSITPHYNANILKSVMKQLDIESSVDIPNETVINCQVGLLVGNNYEYIDYGNYIVYKSEKQEDKNTYKITCYDKMLYSMKQNEDLGVTYPITIKNYLIALATKIGLQVENTSFQNENKEIESELFVGLDYTYRDILDQIAEVAGAIICINSNDKIEVRYPAQTNDTIDEEYIKDINVKFGEKYGPINSIVLSRSAESDNVYLRDEESVTQNGLCEVKIVDNQIMNFNDRSEYLQGILNALDGLEYYINDFDSTGILYYDVGDMYDINIKEQTYNCIMLNDEVDFTTGIKEMIHTDPPEQNETDYKKADKTDIKINQTNLIVDKQGQQIQGVITQIGDRSEKQTTITQDIDGIYQIIEDMEDLTRTEEGTTTITLENCAEGTLLELHIYGNNSVFEYLKASENTIVSDSLVIFGDSEIIVTDEDGNSVTYDLGVQDVLRQSGSVYDEYVLKDGTAKVIRRIAEDGTVLANEQIEDLGEYSISLAEGDNTITIKNYNARLNVIYAIKTEYTDMFATKVEMKSSINQTAQEINTEVRKKVDETEIISKINQSAEQVTIDADKISLNGKTIDMTGDNININSENFSVDSEGNMTCSNANITNGSIELKNETDTGVKFMCSTYDGNTYTQITPRGIRTIYDGHLLFWVNGTLTGVRNYRGQGLFLAGNSIWIRDDYNTDDYYPIIINGSDGKITCVSLTQTSKEENKKNFEKLKSGLDLVLNTDIYKYNLKNEKDTDKKHIGFVIGDKYKYAHEITSEDAGKEIGVDTYSMISVAYKAIQEQQEQIEELKKEIKRLKGV